MPIVAVTGHRPDKIGGYEWTAPQRIWVRDRLREKLLELEPAQAISGMALGVDQDFAYVCIEMAIPFIAAVPFAGQESRWPKPSRDFYNELLSKAHGVVIVSPGEYSVEKMQIRNKWMVDNCHHLISVWDGTSGGTGNCVRYAKETGKYEEAYRINPKDFFQENRPMQEVR